MRAIPLTNSSSLALVDNEQYEKAMLLTWCKPGRYVKSTTRPHVYLHEFLFGKAPKGLEWDHRNRNKLDNQGQNLRVLTHQQNMQNKGIKKTNTTGFVGVRPSRSKWRAAIKIGSRHIGLGTFKTIEEAARARDAAVFRHFGNFAYLNFPIRRFPR